MHASDIQLPDPLIAAPRDQADHLADITSDAFRDDPFNQWLFGNFDAMAITFRALARHLYTRRGFCYRSGDDGAAMWLLPGADGDLPLTVYPSLLHAIIRSSSGAIRRVGRTITAMEAHHPQYPHAYLFTIGVRPHARGKGLGGRLIRPVLAACDRAAIPAYLENSNPENRGFYHAHGFKRVQMIYPTSNSAPLEAMIRQPLPPIT